MAFATISFGHMFELQRTCRVAFTRWRAFGKSQWLARCRLAATDVRVEWNARVRLAIDPAYPHRAARAARGSKPETGVCPNSSTPRDAFGRVPALVWARTSCCPAQQPSRRTARSPPCHTHRRWTTFSK
eukprot:13384805-Alexandrium_andersonii.AAC.1